MGIGWGEELAFQEVGTNSESATRQRSKVLNLHKVFLNILLRKAALGGFMILLFSHLHCHFSAVFIALYYGPVCALFELTALL